MLAGPWVRLTRRESMRKVREAILVVLAQMLQLAMTRPSFSNSWFLLLFHPPQKWRGTAAHRANVHWCFIHSQGKGLGRTLLNKFIELSRLKGYHSVVLSVEEENQTAIALYEKSGFKIIKTFSEGRYQRHRMEYILDEIIFSEV